MLECSVVVANLAGAILLFKKVGSLFATEGVRGTPAAFARGWKIEDGFLAKGSLNEVLKDTMYGLRRGYRQGRYGNRR